LLGTGVDIQGTESKCDVSVSSLINFALEYLACGIEVLNTIHKPGLMKKGTAPAFCFFAL